MKKKNNKKKYIANMGTLYDINKSIIENNIKELTEEEIEEKRKLIEDLLQRTTNKYYMLLCNDRKDYTVFVNEENDIDEFLTILLKECLPNRGIIKSIENTEDEQAIEIWLSIEGESYCYFLFPYDEAIITF